MKEEREGRERERENENVDDVVFCYAMLCSAQQVGNSSR